MKIYQRLKLEGKWRYRPIREGRGVKTGELPPPFYVHPRLTGGSQPWLRLDAQTFADAKKECETVVVTQEADRLGLTVAEMEDKLNSDRVTIAAAVRKFMEDNADKAPKTIQQYALALKQFVESTRGRFVDEVTESTLKHFKRRLEDEGYAPKTIDTRLNVVFFMLKDNNVKARIPAKYMPTVEEEPAEPYTDDELDQLFGAMNPEQRVRYRFFLGSGCRDREVTFAAWRDIDFDANTYVVRRKEDVKFKPKTHESRTIQLPASLVRELKARRDKHPDDRWIFLSKEGKPDNHFLRKLKKIALQAGLNCGQCRSTITVGEYSGKKQIEVTCKTHPVCEHYILHRFRKTCATRWLHAGMSMRDIQIMLGHKSLATTQKYLGKSEPAKLQPQVDRAFGD
jgi:integrase